MNRKLYSQQHHHCLCYSLMVILYNNDCTTCNSFTFSSLEVSLGPTILNSRERRDANDLPANSLPAIIEMQLSVNGVKQHLVRSGSSDWKKCMELSWLENPFASLKINVNEFILAILGVL
ncbi:PREDICTED: uncharacterized protein LOC18593637 isoform X1 [Theobroma cacao]|uniref:Uncharacterized protein LOC18593637 isoform X1 n=1 Tax=Theobroma cacao TaxID=3641 RepID=A0AB32WQA6_THECC|nr:PREDICTED: uncharacterized protein LOC18593637 isoform X1 [Theobroma cacao]